MRRTSAAGAVCGAVLAATGAIAQDLPQAVTTQQEMVVTANPLATEAAAEILRRGGTAVDAMITAQTVLGLVEPQSSGIGGGAFVVYYDAETGELTTFDAREKAPLAAEEDRFLNEAGASIGFVNAWQSGLSVGVPGVPALMDLMHDRYGSMKKQKLVQAAKLLALKGFPLTQRTADQVNGLLARNPSCTDRLYFRDPLAFEYFTNGDLVDCAAKPAGTIIRNRDYGQMLQQLAVKGADWFYEGPVAPAVAKAVRTDLNIPGDMTVDDLAAYEVIERAPVCLNYRGYEVCGMGPPSSGGLAVGQILGILENFEIGLDAEDNIDEPLDVDAVHLFAEAGRLAFADRNKFVGDPDFVTVPAEGMLDEAYLATRAALISPTGNDIGTAQPGTPPGEFDPTAPAGSEPGGGTSHISIVDRFGNALSMTTTIESSFGNGVLVPGFGFLLNNELTDFSFAPTDGEGTPIANRVQPGKRPRSSMSPSIVFDADGDVFLLTGSPGGASIIGYTAQSIVNVIDFGLDPQEAINVPHHQNRNGATNLEAPIPGVTLDYDVGALEEALEARGHPVSVGALTSGLGLIQIGDGVLIGGADQRRDGAVGGR